jgi:hypothetical protein
MALIDKLSELEVTHNGETVGIATAYLACVQKMDGTICEGTWLFDGSEDPPHWAEELSLTYQEVFEAACEGEDKFLEALEAWEKDMEEPESCV